MFKVLKNAESVPTDGFHYDLFSGGYFDPENFLSEKKDIEKVKEAIKTINEYEATLLEEDLIEEL